MNRIPIIFVIIMLVTPAYANNNNALTFLRSYDSHVNNCLLLMSKTTSAEAVTSSSCVKMTTNVNQFNQIEEVFSFADGESDDMEYREIKVLLLKIRANLRVITKLLDEYLESNKS